MCDITWISEGRISLSPHCRCSSLPPPPALHTGLASAGPYTIVEPKEGAKYQEMRLSAKGGSQVDTDKFYVPDVLTLL
jgi:hypothetical protein